MSSVQEVVDSAHNIGSSANQLRMRLQQAIDRLNSSYARLSVLARGSRSGTEALGHVKLAQGALSDAVRQIADLEDSLEDFIVDVQK